MFLVVNVEAFVSDKCVRYVHEFMDKEDVLFAVDESTTIKNHKAKRTRDCDRLAQSCKYRRF